MTGIMPVSYTHLDVYKRQENNKAKNDLLTALTPEQKDVLAEMLQDEHIAGIHDTRCV